MQLIGWNSYIQLEMSKITSFVYNFQKIESVIIQKARNNAVA